MSWRVRIRHTNNDQRRFHRERHATESPGHFERTRLMGYPHPSHARETPILSQHFGEPEARTLHGWTGRGGYQALEKTLSMAQGDIVNIVKEMGLRGRGGAGFSAGKKVAFMKTGGGKPHYLCFKPRQSESGTV